MKRNLLPLGSVVLLKEGEKRLMICGRLVNPDGTDEIFDYSACLYPEGIIDSDSFVFFNSDAIEQLFFIGFQDAEELDYSWNVLDELGELVVENGTIVEKDSIE